MNRARQPSAEVAMRFPLAPLDVLDARARQAEANAGNHARDVVARLDALMERCREDRHELRYQDLVDLKGGA